MEVHADFWDKNAKRYDRFMRKDAVAYRQMYEMIRPVVKSKTVLELATGTGVDRKAHRQYGKAYRSDGCFCGNDCRSQAG